MQTLTAINLDPSRPEQPVRVLCRCERTDQDYRLRWLATRIRSMIGPLRMVCRESVIIGNS
jgi:hypothetical protein